MVTTITTYETIDGKIFDIEEKAIAHEESMLQLWGKYKKQFIVTSNYRKTLDSLPDPSGSYIWRVVSASSVHSPNRTIGYLEGTYEKAIEWAVSRPDFKDYGEFGVIELITPRKV